MRHYFLRRPLLAGLDIQPEGMHFVQLKQIKEEYSIEQAISHPYRQPIFMDSKIKHWEVMQMELSQWVQEARIEGSSVAISLPLHLVRMQRITLPQHLTEIEIEAEIDAHLQRDLPGMNEALNIDFITDHSKQSIEVDVYFAAARRVYILQYVKCVEAAGLKVKVIDVDVYALQRLVYFACRLLTSTEQVNVIIHITHQMATLLVFSLQGLVFHQSYDMQVSADCMTQLNAGMQLFQATFQHLKIERLVVCGKSEALTEIKNGLVEIWQDQVIYSDPLMQMKCGANVNPQLLSATSSAFLIACGLAMREVPKW